MSEAHEDLYAFRRGNGHFGTRDRQKEITKIKGNAFEYPTTHTHTHTHTNKALEHRTEGAKTSAQGTDARSRVAASTNIFHA
jgi:hypothetical protein